MPLELRLAALEDAADTPQLRGRLLMQLATDTRFDPEQTAQAITPLLLELPAEAVYAIGESLDKLLDSPSEGLRSAAAALKVRSGTGLTALAERAPDALLHAVSDLPAEQAPPGLTDQLLTLAASGTLEPSAAIRQAARLSTDTNALFKRLAQLADRAKTIGFDKWGDEHGLAMAAIAGMHELPDDSWPAGYDAYRLGRADPQVLAVGNELYHHEEKGCVKCHGPQGQGAEGFPHLAHSPWVVGDPVRAAAIVKYGLAGVLPNMINPADGKPFNAQMEPLSYFSNSEIAAILTYVRQSWGNFASPVTPEHVVAAERHKGKKEGMWKPDELLAKFPLERDRLIGAPSANTFRPHVEHWSAPVAGVLIMLVVVSAMLALILVPTWLGGGRPPTTGGSHHAAAVA